MYVDELKLDFEERNPQKKLSIKRVGFIARMFRLNIQDVKAWRTARGIHVRIKMKEKLHLITAVLLQSLMGSDYAREAYNTIRVYNLVTGRQTSPTAQETWNVLFYKKLVKGEVASEEKHDEKLSQKLWKELKP